MIFSVWGALIIFVGQQEVLNRKKMMQHFPEARWGNWLDLEWHQKSFWPLVQLWSTSIAGKVTVGVAYVCWCRACIA